MNTVKDLWGRLRAPQRGKGTVFNILKTGQPHAKNMSPGKNDKFHKN